MSDPAETPDVIVVGGGSAGGSFSPAGGAFAVLAALVQPESTGTLKLASPDPGDAPLIDANYLGTARDARRMLEGVKIGRAICRNSVFAPFVAAELLPGDPWAVVDSVGAVRGLAGLRVADASIIPEVPSATTNVTVIMLAGRIYQRVYAI